MFAKLLASLWILIISNFTDALLPLENDYHLFDKALKAIFITEL
jgi:hypothetical protein